MPENKNTELPDDAGHEALSSPAPPHPELSEEDEALILKRLQELGYLE